MTARTLIPSATPDSQWLVYDTSAERDAAEAQLLRSWVTLDDRSVLLNYSLSFTDAQGPALHIAHAPAHGTSGYTQTTTLPAPPREWCAVNNCTRAPLACPGRRVKLCALHGGKS